MPTRAIRTAAVTLTVLALAGGLALVVRATIGLRGDRSLPPDVGSISAGSTSGAGPTGGAGRPAAAGPAGPVPAAPAVLGIPSLQVRAPVLPVASTGGVLGVPDDPAQLGWWTGSALAGAARGSVVIDGHVDSAMTGPGALFRLGRLGPGDRIDVSTRIGGSLGYTVTARRSYPKAAGLPAELFDQAGPARLVLISCGGPFDRRERSYLDNIVVFAAPE